MESSYQEIPHGLEEVPLLVDVQVKVTSGENDGFIFQAQGAAARGDHRDDPYAGVMYVYNATHILISAPTNDSGDSGRVVYTGDKPFWEGPNRTDTYNASVRVRAWTNSTLPTPDFKDEGISIEAGNPEKSTFVTRSHGLGEMPALVISRTKFNHSRDNSHNSVYGDSIGTNIVIYPEGADVRNAYVIFGYNDSTIKVWTSAQKGDGLINGIDGYSIDINETQGELELYAWSESSLAPDYSSSVQLNETLSLTYTNIETEDNTFTRAGVQAIEGSNDGYIFPGSGHQAYDNRSSDYQCNYGGLAYGYTSTEIRFWRPGSDKKGAVICIPTPMGNGNDNQNSTNGVARFSIWKLDTDECIEETDNCHANATCTNTVGNYNCSCNNGYDGNGTFCSDIDECIKETDGCHSNATCTNTDGNFICMCNDGYDGNGTFCSDIDECDGEHNCHTNASCTNNPGSFKCDCNSGYDGNGTFCSDIDECIKETDECHSNATCTNSIGNYNCKCNDGYDGNGTFCSDIDECNGEQNCHTNASCTNNPGSFKCDCNSGYSGNGTTCSDINECTEKTHNCDINAACSNTKGNFTCKCDTGYSGNGETCTDINECTKGTDDCHDEANCTNSAGSYSCACNVGYSGNGVTCTDDDECTDETHNCHFGADCTNSPGSYSCICDNTDGFYGDGTSCSQVICYPNNTINVHHLPANYYYYAMQNVSSGNDVMCNVTDINSTSVTITGCSKDMPILMSYGTFDGMVKYRVHGGQTLVTVTIKCNEISIDGVADSIHNSLGAILSVEEKASADPTYKVTSSLNPISTTVGRAVSWTIYFPVEYVLQVTSCTANPGTSFLPNASTISLISNGGCQKTDELISSFTDNFNGTATATILAFKFYETPNVYLKCDLKLCPSTSNCNTACTRIKRSVIQHRPGREVNAEEYTTHVHSVLHVVLAGASSLVPGSSVSVLLTLTLVSWCM